MDSLFAHICHVRAVHIVLSKLILCYISAFIGGICHFYHILTSFIRQDWMFG